MRYYLSFSPEKQRFLPWLMEKQIEDAMSKTNNEQFTCDECDFNQDISLYVSINAKQNPELKENIINKNLNR